MKKKHTLYKNLQYIIGMFRHLERRIQEFIFASRFARIQVDSRKILYKNPNWLSQDARNFYPLIGCFTWSLYVHWCNHWPLSTIRVKHLNRVQYLTSIVTPDTIEDAICFHETGALTSCCHVAHDAPAVDLRVVTFYGFVSHGSVKTTRYVDRICEKSKLNDKSYNVAWWYGLPVERCHQMFSGILKNGMGVSIVINPGKWFSSGRLFQLRTRHFLGETTQTSSWRRKSLWISSKIESKKFSHLNGNKHLYGSKSEYSLLFGIWKDVKLKILLISCRNSQFDITYCEYSPVQ